MYIHGDLGTANDVQENPNPLTAREPAVENDFDPFEGAAGYAHQLALHKGRILLGLADNKLLTNELDERAGYQGWTATKTHDSPEPRCPLNVIIGRLVYGLPEKKVMGEEGTGWWPISTLNPIGLLRQIDLESFFLE